MNKQKCIFSIDVEDWFHILDTPATPDISKWSSLESTVEKNFNKMLEILQEKEVRATCFFLGWIAEKFPHLVKDAVAQGHEVASHGYGHELVYEMGQERFLEDIIKVKGILEDISGSEVIGYRAAGYSVTEETPWFFDALLQAGYRYSSSVFPASRGHGGMKYANYAPNIEKRKTGEIIEFPITVTKQFGKPICFFGGGYLRLFPYFIIKKKAQGVLSENRPVIFYIHPREIDPEHPRLPMGIKRTFKSYVNIRSTERKIKKILEEFNFITLREYYKAYK